MIFVAQAKKRHVTFLPVLAVQYRWRYCVILNAWAPSAVPAMPVEERFYLGDSLSVGILSSCPVRASTAFARGGAFSSVHVCFLLVVRRLIVCFL